ncbi:PIN domain-containing protein [Peijinzhouia sedimentorum]
MNNNKILIDTRILAALLDGNSEISSFLQGKDVHISIITEMELLGNASLDTKKIVLLKRIIREFTVISLTDSVKERAIILGHEFGVNLDEAIKAASAIEKHIPMCSSNKNLSKISQLDLLLIHL